MEDVKVIGGYVGATAGMLRAAAEDRAAGTSAPTVEPWTYEVDGVEFEGRRVWHCETPGPIGCGVWWNATVHEDRYVDGMWERHIYEWEHSADPAGQS